MPAGQAKHPIQAGSFAFTILQIGAVQNAPSPELLEAGLHHLGLGRIEDHRNGHVCGKRRSQLCHVLHPVTADVVDAEVDHVGPLLDLGLPNGHTRLDVVCEEGRLEGLGAIRVGPLTNHQK